MGSLSQMKTMVSKEYRNTNSATYAGVGAAGAGAALLAASRKLPERTAAASRKVNAAYRRSLPAVAGAQARANNAAANVTATRRMSPGRKIANIANTRAQADLAQVQANSSYLASSARRANQLVNDAPFKQKVLRRRGAGLALAGVGLGAYGIYGSRKNKQATGYTA